MKLRFKQQQYQTDAVDALVRVFAGQGKGIRKETVSRDKLFVDEIFSNKKIDLDEGAILKNVQGLQKEHGLEVSQALEGRNFTIEMETGTGKTYVYTKAMYELNQKYGWNKFIIMVPSIAIREGVHKSLEITAEHFQEVYGKKIRFFIYDNKNKSNITNIKSFANTTNIEVVIMNHQAFATKSKESRKIYQKLDQLQSEKPIDIIKRARPILIIDEPQRFGDKAGSMLKEFNPLFITRYSATHKKDYSKIYRLDAIDAYNQKLVKKIKVKGIEVKGNAGTNSYLFLDQIHVSAKTYPSATVQIELEAKQATGIKKVLKRINEGDDLFVLSGEMVQYKGYVVKEINAATNTVSFVNGEKISVGQVMGDVDEKHLRTIQIRETIKSHIEKERELFKRGIKVLTLFFIDEVKKYREYDEKGDAVRAEYEEIFEEEYKNAIAERGLFDEEYNKYLDKHPVEKVHNGYFSIDKKGKAIDSTEKRGETGSDDVDAYDLIMKDKERLLSFNESTRFIFSHSALREGWDNPNIFQICTLRHTKSTMSKRQEIGRGLRIAVDSDGHRMDTSILGQEFFDVNTLTVVANESYESFAKDLQKEILDSLKGRPVTLETSVFENIELKNKVGDTKVLSDREIRHLLAALEAGGYIDEQDHVTQKFVDDREAGTLELPEKLEEFKETIVEIISKVHSTNSYKAAEDAKAENVDERDYKTNNNFAKKEFQDLWNKIKVKTVYEVDFDSEELIKKCVSSIDASLEVRTVTARIVTGTQNKTLTEKDITEGVGLTKIASQIEKTESILGSIKYDLLHEVARGGRITRKTASEILSKIKADTFAMFKRNPEDFIKGVVQIVNNQKAATLIDNVTYTKTDQVYTDDVFTINHLRGSLEENIMAVKNHVYDYVKTDSKVERKFATDLDSESKVLVYAKLPRGFQIPTPVGNYNPDWAIVFEEKDVKHIYFIAETKGDMQSLQLKGAEKQKIDYAKKHFASLGHAELTYDVVDSYESLVTKIMR
ncbi:restriction endonuclease subunit R [Candidatus Kaiserbacteria bacterium]|nr:MAG: restriction endonuclease subunit R [Candidatus Kaiserbacteria bacterium]